MLKFSYYLFYVLSILSCIGGIGAFLTGLQRMPLHMVAVNAAFDFAFAGVCWLLSRWLKKKLDAKESSN